MDEPNFTVRPASADCDDDVAALLALRRRWRVEEHAEDAGDSSFDDYFARWVNSHAVSHRAFLGELDGVAGAMAWLAIVDRVPSPATPVRTNGYIQSVYVIPPLRNAGHGSVLLQAVVDEAKQLGLDYLAVHPSQFAFPFYKRLGFAPTARVLEMDFRVRVDPEVGR